MSSISLPTRRLRLLSSLVAAGSVAFLASKTAGQEVFSQIVGAVAFNLPAETDVTLAANFMPSPVFRGPLDGPATGASLPLPSDSLEADAFDAGGGHPLFYLYVESGLLEGQRLDIVGNGSSSVEVDPGLAGGGALADLAADDIVSIRPHWTLDDAFPGGVAFHTESSPGLREIEVILPLQSNEGEGLVVNRIFFHFDGAWREVGEPLDADAGKTVLPPGNGIVIRNNGSARTSHFFGEVADTPIAVPLKTAAAASVDNYVGIERPLPIALDDLGLVGGGSGSAFVETTSADDIKDQLLVFAAAAPGKNKQPVAAYFFHNGAWRKVGSDISTDFGQDKIEPSNGILIRKAANGSDATQFWVNKWELPQSQ